MASPVKTSGATTFLVDPVLPSRDHAEREFLLVDNRRIWLVPLAVGAVLLLLSVVGWIVNPPQFYFSYLVGWSFCLTLSLGALFSVMIHHITSARWSVVVRRIPEMLAWSFPVLAILGAPILIGMHDLFHWTHHDLYVEGSEAYDPILAGKRPYLNTPFFLIRYVFYFVVWSYLAYRLYRFSLQQDLSADTELTARQKRVSGWGLPVFGVTLAFASYDLLMSLDPHWFSTIFGVYIFSGAFVSIHALIALIVIAFQRYSQGTLEGVVTIEHIHDLGKWMFAFTVFWAYIAYSQYMLIWYGNLPEETLWFEHRLSHGWEWHSLVLLLLRFVVPFVILLPRRSKRNVPLLAVMAVLILVMQWFDMHWLAMPVLHAENAGFHWLDFTCWLGLAGVFAGMFLFRAGRHSLVPRRDPYLSSSLRFENV